MGGDWAGYANTWIEKEFTDAISLMTIGCGADVGPQPSGSLELAKQHGKSIAAEVKKLLAGEMTRLEEMPTVAVERIKLPLAEPQPREYWDGQLKTTGLSHQLAKFILEQHDKTGSIPSEVDYPLSVWKFGTDLAIVFLAGEVVVDYSVRLKHELDWERLWITAWANDMPGYIPSRRVLVEGGYEADFSQVYYGQPGRYDVKVEDVLTRAVTKLVGDHFAAKTNQPPAPFHELPSGEPLAFKRLGEWIAAEKVDEEATIFDKTREYLPRAKPGIDRVTKNDGESTRWYNFAGDFVDRVFIRQQAVGTTLTWQTPVIANKDAESVVLCFSGGAGWVSQPKTEGFELLINDAQTLRFDVTRKPSRWTSADKSVELLYLPTWTSNEDSGGFFFLACSNPKVDGGRISVSVRSLGKDSLRWFAIDSKQNMPARLKKLATMFE